MSANNEHKLTGKVCKGIKTGTAKNGNAFISFNLKVNNNYKLKDGNWAEPDFFNITYYCEHAEKLLNVIKEGSIVIVSNEVKPVKEEGVFGKFTIKTKSVDVIESPKTTKTTTKEKEPDYASDDIAY